MKYWIIFWLMIMTKLSFADNVWQCMANDGEEKQWLAKNAYERVANNKAFELCKKESHVPGSCKARQDACNFLGSDEIEHERSTSTNTNLKWQCTALDEMAKSWINHPIANRDEAAMNAKSQCLQHSSMPDSCYINFSTCKRI